MTRGWGLSSDSGAEVSLPFLQVLVYTWHIDSTVEIVCLIPVFLSETYSFPSPLGQGLYRRVSEVPSQSIVCSLGRGLQDNKPAVIVRARIQLQR